MHGPAERLDAETIAGAEGGQAQAIPYDKGEHAMQLLDDVHAPTAVAFENHLRIGSCSKDRALACQQLAQLEEIINFAVEDDHIAPVSALHRLIAGSQVNDRQPAMAEEHIA